MQQKSDHAPHHSAEPLGLTLETIKAVLFNNWKFIAIVSFLGMAGGVVYNQLHPKTYLVNATLLIGPENKATSEIGRAHV